MDDLNMTIGNLTRSARHISFVSFSSIPTCVQVHQALLHDKCNFVRETDSCHASVQFFDSMDFLYCTVGAETTRFNFAFIVLVMLVLYLFMFLGQAADVYFCPTLALMSNKLGISEAVAGVTILAFGNGSPDIFTAFATVENDTVLVYTELLGAAIFIITVVGGAVLIIKPSHIDRSNIWRDIIFFLFTIIFISLCMFDQEFSLVEAIVTASIYVSYLIYVITEHLLKVYKRNKLRRIGSKEGNDKLNRLNELTILPLAEHEVSLEAELANSNYRLFSLFFEAINPLDMESFRESNIFMKLFMILMIPVNFVLKLTIPLVDYDYDRCGWCKLLNMLHCYTVPTAIILCTTYQDYKLFGVSIWAFVYPASTLLALLIFCTSKTMITPGYYDIFAIPTFLICIIYISTAASEIVSVLQTIGNVLELTSAFIGLSILAWGNSVGDLFTNTALARQGYQRMAFAACFGGPMFNTILGIATIVIMKALRTDNHVARVRDGVLGPTCVIFLYHTLIFLLFGLILTHYRCRRCIGLFLLILYGVFFLFASLSEFQVIHAYGTDHNDEAAPL